MCYGVIGLRFHLTQPCRNFNVWILLAIRFLQKDPFTGEQDLDLPPSRNSTQTAYETPFRLFSVFPSPNRLEEVAPFKQNKFQTTESC